MGSDEPILFVPVGSNQARPFGMTARDRAYRLAANAGFECADTVQPGRPALIASLAYGWDPLWLKELRGRPGSVLMLAGKPVIAHVPADGDAATVAAAVENVAPVAGYDVINAETAELSNTTLRKRERPFVLPLDPNPEPVERAAY